MNENATELIPYRFALEDTWLAISHEVLQAMDIESINRTEVIDIVLDAERVERYSGMTQAQLRVWYAQSETAKRELAGLVFWQPVYN